MLVPCEWTGDGFTVARGFQKAADQHFVIGYRYILEPAEERSAKSHRHYFACIREAWLNLPEHLAADIASPEALRKRALIMTGYRDETAVVCSSAEEARKVAAFVAPADAFSVVSVVGSTVVRWTAQSQSTKAMDRQTFKRSKDETLDWIAALIGSTPEDLSNCVQGAA